MNKLLREVGEALYGESWQSALARDLDVSDRTMRRWVAGDSALPDGIWSDLAKLVKQRGKRLEALLLKLYTQTPPPPQ